MSAQNIKGVWDPEICGIHIPTRAALVRRFVPPAFTKVWKQQFFRRYVWKRPHWYCERPHWYEHCHRSSLLSGRQSPCWKYQRSFELLWTELDIHTHTQTKVQTDQPGHAGFHSVARCKTSWGLCGVVWADILRPRVKFKTSGTKHWQPANGPMANDGQWLNMVELKPHLN